MSRVASHGLTLLWLVAWALAGCSGQGGSTINAPGFVSGDDWVRNGGVGPPPQPVSCQGRADPGRVVLHRINQTEYNNTVRDLLGDNTNPANAFPPDLMSNGFDNNAEGLVVTDSHVFEYEIAAQGLAERAIAAGSPVRSKYVTCPGGSGTAGQTCAKQVLTAFLRKAWRRPPTTDEVGRYVKFLDVAAAHGEGFDAGLELAFTAALLSPNFLFRPEPDPTAGATRPLSGHEVASRLSYFLWSSMPDDELFAAADTGALSTTDQIAQQVERMLQSPKAQALRDNLAGQWLGVRQLASSEISSTEHPAWDDALRDAMASETRLFMKSMLTEQLPIKTLLLADFAHVNQRLASHYGLSGVTGTQVQRVSLAGTQRLGILGQASTLTATGSATGSLVFPIHRGVWILSQVLCSPPPPPPDNLNTSFTPVDRTAAMREQLSQHRANPVCAGCHDSIDPLGFGLQNFGGIGEYRTTEGTATIDATGELSEGVKFNGPVEMARALAEDPRFASCVTKQIFAYGIGRPPATSDDCTVNEVSSAVVAANESLRDVVVRIAQSDAFRFKR